MKGILTIIISTFLLFISSSLWFPIHALPPCQGLGFPGNEFVFGPVTDCGLNTPAGFISGFLPAILAIAGFITVIIIVISGIQFILSSGNPEAAAAARGRLTFALVGFALIILAFAILQIVNRLFLGPTGVAFSGKLEV